jgi:hypothetical protein
MLQQLTANSNAAWFAIGSTLFFIIIFAGVVLRVLSRKAGSYDATARLPLEDPPSTIGGEHLAAQDESRTGGR